MSICQRIVAGADARSPRLLHVDHVSSKTNMRTAIYSRLLWAAIKARDDCDPCSRQ